MQASEEVLVLREKVRQLQDIIRPKHLYFAKLDLTPKELALLVALFTAPEGVASFERCKAAMWEDGGSTASFKVVLSRLRRKLRAIRVYIVNVHTFGVRLDANGRKKLRGLSRRIS